MKKTRILAFALVAMMMLSMLPGAMAATKEDTVIKYLGPYVTADLNEDFVAKKLQEITGFQVQYDQMPQENADQMLMMEVASGTDYDILFTSVNQYNMLSAQGALKPLNALLEKYPYIQEVTMDSLWNLTTTEDGTIYGIPQGEYGLIYGGIGYRVDLFEKYGWTAPNTVDELYELCKEIKEKTGLIPIATKHTWIEEIASGFGLDYDYVVNEDGTVTSKWRDPAMKEYIAFMAKLYSEGLIDPDLPVNTSAMVEEKVTSGQAAMFSMKAWNRITWEPALQEVEADAKMDDFWIALEDADGNRHINATPSVTYVACIPATCDDEVADLVFQMIARRLEPDTYWLMNCGIEGTHWQYDENGIPSPIQPIFGEEMNYGDKMWIGINITEHMKTKLCRQNKDWRCWEIFSAAQVKTIDYKFNGNPLSLATCEAYTTYNSALSTKMSDYMLAVIAGTDSLDNYDAMMAEWEAEGGLEVEEGLTKWYQENKDFADALADSSNPYKDMMEYFK